LFSLFLTPGIYIIRGKKIKTKNKTKNNNRVSGHPCHKGTSWSYTQKRQTPGRNESDPMAFREDLGLGCDGRQHHGRVLRRCRSSRTKTGCGNGCHQEMSEVI